MFGQDPRPDLVEDSAAWTRLLLVTHAMERNQQDATPPDGVFATLLGARCIGMRYQEGALRPRKESEADWPALRERMLRHRDIVATLLRLCANRD